MLTAGMICPSPAGDLFQATRPNRTRTHPDMAGAPSPKARAQLCRRGRIMSSKPRRGANRFKLTDAKRAVKSARDTGLDPIGLDVIVAADGSTTFRVHGANAPQMAQAPGASEWNE